MLEKRLRECRDIKNVTQRQVADYLGITVPAYTRYEMGQREPNISTLNRLADYFGVSLDYLAGRSDSRKLQSNEASAPSEIKNDAQ